LTNITRPSTNQVYFSDEYLNLSAVVHDDAGNQLFASNGIALKWYYYLDNHCADIYIGDGTGINFTYNWNVLTSQAFLNVQYMTSNWVVRAAAYNATFYGGDSYLTQADFYNQNECLSGTARFGSHLRYINKMHWFEIVPFTAHKTQVLLTIPSADTAELEADDYVNFTCQTQRLNDSQDLTYAGQQTVYFWCHNCNMSANKQLFSQAINLNGEAKFRLNFSNETRPKLFNFTCSIQNQSHFFTFTPYNNDTRQMRIVNNLGGGAGQCDYDQVCEPANGETCATCPDDCGFNNLPAQYKPVSPNSTGCGCNGPYNNATGYNDGDGQCLSNYEASNSCNDCNQVDLNRRPDVRNNQSNRY
ncbi:hypothetical protein COY95_04520, partial [Candidatus Woesearchaeota archaeon CG_4_10_14_0_8_um_filter_47_5]